MKDTGLVGKKCYNHLGGKLGAVLFEFLVTEGWIAAKPETPTIYEVTEKGVACFRTMGIELPENMIKA